MGSYLFYDYPTLKLFLVRFHNSFEKNILFSLSYTIYSAGVASIYEKGMLKRDVFAINIDVRSNIHIWLDTTSTMLYLCPINRYNVAQERILYVAAKLIYVIWEIYSQMNA